MTSILNFIWFVVFGWVEGLAFLLLGCLFYLSVIGIPIGTAMFEFAKLMAFPFGKAIVRDGDRGGAAKAGHVLLNVVWFPFGLFVSAYHLLLAIPLFVGIITIPAAIVSLRVAKFALSPFGIRVITKEEALARRTAELLYRMQNGSAADGGPAARSGAPGVGDAGTAEPLPDIRTDPETFAQAFGNISRFVKSAYSDFRKFQRSLVSDGKFYAGIAAAVAVGTVGALAYSAFHEPTYFVGKDVRVDPVLKTVRTMRRDEPVTGKIVFKKDGDVLLSYATAVDGYIDTSFETYLNGKPKSESHSTYEWNKDTKSEYSKEWYENGKMKRHARFGKEEEWDEAGTKTYEKTEGAGSASVKRWNAAGKLTDEEAYENGKLATDSKLTYGRDGELAKKIAFVHSETGALSAVADTYRPDGKVRTRELFEGDTMVARESFHANGNRESAFDSKSGSGTTYYPDGSLESHTESGSYLKTGYFPNGKVAYDYAEQVGKTFDESGVLLEECKKVETQGEVADCGGIFGICFGMKTISYEAVRCFDSSGAYLYEAPSRLGWKSLKTAAELRDMPRKAPAAKTPAAAP